MSKSVAERCRPYGNGCGDGDDGDDDSDAGKPTTLGASGAALFQAFRFGENSLRPLPETTVKSRAVYDSTVRQQYPDISTG